MSNSTSSSPDKSVTPKNSGGTTAEAAPTKGRPTPTRKEAEAARKQQLKPALTRKEAKAREREARARNRNAMMAGDEKALLPRDQGPVKRAVREFVDGRRTVAELFLPGALLMLALGFVRSVDVQQLSLIVWLVLVLGIAVDALIWVRAMRKELRTRFEPSEIKGVTFYAIMRALQIRRLRVPKSSAKPGDNRRKAAAED